MFSYINKSIMIPQILPLLILQRNFFGKMGSEQIELAVQGILIKDLGSFLRTVSSGKPQHSVLGTHLLNIFVNDLNET